MGHIRRCCALARALRERGLGARVRALSDEAGRLLPEAPSAEGEIGLVVIDLPVGCTEQIGLARSRAIPCVALDYAGPGRADLTISLLERSTPPFDAPRLSGFPFAIIRSEVASLRPAAGGRGILVCLGGGDLRDEGARAAARAAALGEPVTLIEGPCRPRPYEAPPGVGVIGDPPDLPLRMASCRWAIANGGGTMLELMCLGKAVRVLPQTPAEEELASLFLKKGALLGMGLEGLEAPPAGLLESVGAAAARLIDGRGVERICDALGGLL
jgi:spore coat polysaccharide biosynthesis predicted glycosyltransferase SpsG